MMTKTHLGLVLAMALMHSGCSHPTASPSGQSRSPFEFNRSGPFQWGMNKERITSTLPSDEFDHVWNSKRVHAYFAEFGQSEYRLFFDFNDNTLAKAEVIIMKTNDLDEAKTKLFDLYEYLTSRQVRFDGKFNKMNRIDFIAALSNQSGVSTAKSLPFPPLTARSSSGEKFIVYIAIIQGKTYAPKLQISRS